jgi:hypothetical protein
MYNTTKLSWCKAENSLHLSYKNQSVHCIVQRLPNFFVKEHVLTQQIFTERIRFVVPHLSNGSERNEIC